jgi:glutathionylspermidine synthase
MYGKEYCTTSLAIYREEELAVLQQASEQVDRIFTKVLRFTQRYVPDVILLNQLGIPPGLITSSRIEVPFHGLTRQDWILGKEGPKLIENNTDTPTGIPETAYLTGSIIHDLGSESMESFRVLQEDGSLHNPSVRMDDLIGEAFATLIRHYQELGLTGHIAFSCYDWHQEDLYNTNYLIGQVERRGFNPLLAPMEQLQVIENDGLYFQGQKIEIWYRLYPLEYLVHDQDEDGFQTGQAILSLIEQGKLAIINPTQSILTQSKGFLALIWSLYEKNGILPKIWGLKDPLFSEEELKIIQSFFLPTYFSNLPLMEQGKSFVEKAIYGREGKGTTLFNTKGEQEEVEFGQEKEEIEETKRYYGEQLKIYQERYEMEKVELHLDSTVYEGYLLSGVFVIGGKYAGLLPRVGGRITGDMAYYCPGVLLK